MNDQLTEPTRNGTPIEIPELEYFIFGSYAGNCGGDCAQLYRWIDYVVQSDSVAIWAPGAPLYFRSVNYGLPGTGNPLGTPAYGHGEAVIELINAFPEALGQTEETVFGCPDCMDQGGYYLELKTASSHRSWAIDTRNEPVPDYLNAYKLKIWETMDLLEQ